MSHERRLRRVLNDPGITWQQVYQPTVKQVLRWQRGQHWKGRSWLFKKVGWRSAGAVASWGPRHKESLLLASSLPARRDLIDLYRKRSAIEALFRDRKSAG